MSEPVRTEADAVAELSAKAAKPELVELYRDHALVVPKGSEVFSVKEFLDEYLPNPIRRKGTTSFTDLASFIEHAKRFASTDSVIFAEPSETAPKLTSVLDYHLAGPDDEQVKARHGEHRGVYHFPLSAEWKTWTKAGGVPMTQASFAEFIETNALDVLDPVEAGESAKAFAAKLGCTFASPSRLMALSRGLAVTVNSRVQNAVNLSSGEGQIAYAVEHQEAGGKPLDIPGAFLLALRVFRRGDLYQVPARLRYRVKDGGVSWHFELYRADRIFDDAFEASAERAKTDTGLAMFQGMPER